MTEISEKMVEAAARAICIERQLQNGSTTAFSSFSENDRRMARTALAAALPLHDDRQNIHGIHREIAAERLRQMTVEGWTPEHDDKHARSELAHAAAAYALHAGIGDSTPPYFWPWELEWWKPKDARRDLIRAAALIVAEIERIGRAALIAEDHGEKR